MKRKIIVLIMIMSIVGLSISMYNILTWKKDANKINNQIKDIQENVVVEEIPNNPLMENDGKAQEVNPYWDYIQMNLINVDFSELALTNNDVKGWLQVNGTNINYPFVQGKDNSYYLTHSFDKSYNRGGWVFLDYRNSIKNLNRNTIIYAHGRADQTMFGTLKNILNNGWLSNSNNYVVKMSDEYENTMWQVFSVYRIPTTSDYLKINFNNDEVFLSFVNMLLNRSVHNFKTIVEKDDYILTLSTCYNKKEKVVLHAKLIKRELK